MASIIDNDLKQNLSMEVTGVGSISLITETETILKSTNFSQIVPEGMSFYRFYAEAKFSFKIRDSNNKLLYHSSINKHGFREISNCDNSALIIRKKEGKFGSYFITSLEFTNSNAVKNDWFRKLILKIFDKIKALPKYLEEKLDKEIDKFVERAFMSFFDKVMQLIFDRFFRNNRN
jgi:hypothetical protein